jgi:hypothetical protein
MPYRVMLQCPRTETAMYNVYHNSLSRPTLGTVWVPLLAVGQPPMLNHFSYLELIPGLRPLELQPKHSEVYT